MSDVEIGKVTVTRYLSDKGGDYVNVETEPKEMTMLEIVGLLTFAIGGTLAPDEDDEDS